MVADIRALTDTQNDVLREVANIGAGHAATALSTMTRRKVMISVPRISISPLDRLIEDIANHGPQVTVITMSMGGGIEGHTVLVFPLSTAHRLANLMLEREPSGTSDLSPLEESAVAEAGNILAGTYLTALSEFMRLDLLLSPPELRVGQADVVLKPLCDGNPESSAFVFCVETQFMLDGVNPAVPGYFLLLPTPDSLNAMLRAVYAG